MAFGSSLFNRTPELNLQNMTGTIQIICAESATVFEVHETLLTNASPFFRRHLATATNVGPKPIVAIPEPYTAQAFHEFVRYLYGNNFLLGSSITVKLEAYLLAKFLGEKTPFTHSCLRAIQSSLPKPEHLLVPAEFFSLTAKEDAARKLVVQHIGREIIDGSDIPSSLRAQIPESAWQELCMAAIEASKNSKTQQSTYADKLPSKWKPASNVNSGPCGLFCNPSSTTCTHKGVGVFGPSGLDQKIPPDTGSNKKEGLFSAQPQSNAGGPFDNVTQNKQGGLFSFPSQNHKTGLFGAPVQTTNCGLFGTQPQDNNGGLFGMRTQVNGRGLFGAPAENKQASPFGAQPQSTSGGVFGQPGLKTVTGFGAPSQGSNGGVFGCNWNSAHAHSPFGKSHDSQPNVGPFSTNETQQNPFGCVQFGVSPGSGSLFGGFGNSQPNAPGTGLFGSKPPAQTSSQAPCPGTLKTTFEPFEETDWGTKCSYNSISMMPPYREYSAEELRLEDYKIGTSMHKEASQPVICDCMAKNRKTAAQQRLDQQAGSSTSSTPCNILTPATSRDPSPAGADDNQGQTPQLSVDKSQSSASNPIPGANLTSAPASGVICALINPTPPMPGFWNAQLGQAAQSVGKGRLNEHNCTPGCDCMTRDPEEATLNKASTSSPAKQTPATNTAGRDTSTNTTGGLTKIKIEGEEKDKSNDTDDGTAGTTPSVPDAVESGEMITAKATIMRLEQQLALTQKAVAELRKAFSSPFEAARQRAAASPQPQRGFGVGGGFGTQPKFRSSG